MPGHGEKLTRKQDEVIAALLVSPSQDAAAQQCGINTSTLGRWQKDPGFQAAYREAKRGLVVHATTLLQRMASAAVGTLGAIMVDKTAPASSRVAAARTVLELSLRGVELDDLLTRLETLEARAAHDEQPL
jgi:hypothetical protein